MLSSSNIPVELPLCPGLCALRHEDFYDGKYCRWNVVLHSTDSIWSRRQQELQTLKALHLPSVFGHWMPCQNISNT
jgi:hypothetical protein